MNRHELTPEERARGARRGGIARQAKRLEFGAWFDRACKREGLDPNEQREKLIVKALQLAARGDMQAIGTLLDRLFGKPVQPVASESGQPLVAIQVATMSVDMAEAWEEFRQQYQALPPTT